MLECLICYQYHSSLVFLNCLHSLCKSCLDKLEVSICPFCRMKIENVEKNIYEEQNNNVIQIKIRSKTKFRTQKEVINIGGRIITIKTSYKKRYK